MKCVAGCRLFSGEEKRHHFHCPKYRDSFSEMFNINKEMLRIATLALEQMVNYNSAFHPLLPRIEKCAWALDEINDPEFRDKVVYVETTR